MSELDQIIKVTITRNTTTPTQVGFGTPLLFTADPKLNPVAGKEWGSERVRAYSSLEGVAEDFDPLTNTYAMARTEFSQNPAPSIVKVGRRENLSPQAATFTPVDTTENATVGFTLNGLVIAVTNGAAETVASIVTALAAETPPAGWTFTDPTPGTSTELDIDGPAAGDVGIFAAPVGGDIADVTADAGIAADILAVEAYDNDWYAVQMDSASLDEVEGLATEIEALEKLYLARSVDTDVPDLASGVDVTSIGAILKASALDRTAVFYTESGDFLDAGMAGRALPTAPGSITWAYKTIAGVTADSFNATQILNLEAKDVNFNTTIAGVNVTRYGTVASGEYIDVMRGADWLKARIQERIYALLVNNEKVAYTDAGIQSIRGEILAQMTIAVAQGFLAADPPPTCTVPLAAQVNAADKGNRILRNVVFRATLAGAIHKVEIVGELNL